MSSHAACPTCGNYDNGPFAEDRMQSRNATHHADWRRPPVPSCACQGSRLRLSSNDWASSHISCRSGYVPAAPLYPHTCAALDPYAPSADLLSHDRMHAPPCCQPLASKAFHCQHQRSPLPCHAAPRHYHAPGGYSNSLFVRCSPAAPLVHPRLALEETPPTWQPFNERSYVHELPPRPRHPPIPPQVAVRIDQSLTDPTGPDATAGLSAKAEKGSDLDVQCSESVSVASSSSSGTASSTGGVMKLSAMRLCQILELSREELRRLDLKLLERALLDCYGRFLLNLPASLLADHVHLHFQVQEGHWWYEDFWYDAHPEALPKINLKSFGLLLCESFATLQRYVPESVRGRLLRDWMDYCRTIPLRGAIIFNMTFTKVLLVQGWKGSRWTFPRGKIDEAECDETCAAREVMEEVGLDVSPLIHKNLFIERRLGKQCVKLFIVCGVSEKTPLAPRTRKEISDIKWVPISSLSNGPRPKVNKARQRALKPPAAFPKGSSAVTIGAKIRFTQVAPFRKGLHRWLDVLRARWQENDRKMPNHASFWTETLPWQELCQLQHPKGVVPGNGKDESEEEPQTDRRIENVRSPDPDAEADAEAALETPARLEEVIAPEPEALPVTSTADAVTAHSLMALLLGPQAQQDDPLRNKETGTSLPGGPVTSTEDETAQALGPIASKTTTPMPTSATATVTAGDETRSMRSVGISATRKTQEAQNRVNPKAAPKRLAKAPRKPIGAKSSPIVPSPECRPARVAPAMPPKNFQIHIHQKQNALLLQPQGDADTPPALSAVITPVGGVESRPTTRPMTILKRGEKI